MVDVIRYTLSRYNSLIEGCCVFQMWAFATTPRASLIEILSSCATRQAPLRKIRLLRLLQIRVMWGHGRSEEKSLHPCCLSAKEVRAGVCQGATGPRVDVKYTVACCCQGPLLAFDLCKPCVWSVECTSWISPEIEKCQLKMKWRKGRESFVDLFNPFTNTYKNYYI